MPAAGRFRNMQGQGMHAINLSDVSEAAYNCAEIGGDRSLQGQQGKGVAFGLGGLEHEIVVVADHCLGQADVGFEKGLGGLLHRLAGEAAHVADAVGQRVELFVKHRSHAVYGRTCRHA